MATIRYNPSSFVVTSAFDDLNDKVKELEGRLSKVQSTERVTCENCGAPLPPSGKCPYCGTQYERKHDSPYSNEKYFEIVMEKPGVHTFKAVAAIDNYLYQKAPPEAIANMAMRQIKEQMMDNLAAFIRFDKYDDYHNDKTLIQGTIRVVDPTYHV